MPEHALLVSIVSLLSGAMFGSSIRTQTEGKARRGAPGWQPFNNGSSIGILLNQIAKILLLAVVCAAIVILPLRYADAYPLSTFNRQLLGYCWLAGAALGKLVRYAYWRRRLQASASFLSLP